MAEKPILFSTPMVQAILEGRKTMTRRVIKNAIGWDPIWKVSKETDTSYCMRAGTQYSVPYFKCPYGQPGDLLWVRETFYAYGHWEHNGTTKTLKQKWRFLDRTYWNKNMPDGGYYYEDKSPSNFHKGYSTVDGYYIRPSMFMPKEAARIWLRVTDIRVERFQDISEEDAIDEGIEIFKDEFGFRIPIKEQFGFYRTNITSDAFRALWININGPESWDLNPFVWVVSFEVVSKNGKYSNDK